MAPPKSNKPNPFDLHVNKKKFNVIGRKTKGERGRPSYSKTSALKKRKDTLLKEYKTKHKVNQFVDRRIGEFDRNLSKDEKMMKRMVSLSRKKKSKKDKFNLNEEDVLTHGGTVLTDANMNDDVGFSDDDDMDRLDADFVENQHFGGGSTFKSDKLKSKKEKLLETIAESKKKRYETKKQEEKHREEIAELNKELNTLDASIFRSQRTETKAVDEHVKSGYDPYDMLVKSLEATKRTEKVSEPSKTEQEIYEQQKKFMEYQNTKAEERKKLNTVSDDEEEGTNEVKDTEKSAKNKVKVPKAPQLKLIREIEPSFQPKEIPEEFSDFWKLVMEHTSAGNPNIFETLVRSCHPATPWGSAEKYQLLLHHLVEALQEIGQGKKSRFFDLVDTIIKHIIIVGYGLKKYFVSYILQVFNRKTDEWEESGESMPKADLILFLHLCSEIFPVSDYQHPILTPVRMFISNILREGKLSTRREVFSYLVLLSLLIKMSSTPVRVCTGIIASFRRLFTAVIPSEEVPILSIYRLSKYEGDFALNWACTNDVKKTVSNSFRVGAFMETIAMAKKYFSSLKAQKNVAGWFLGSEFLDIIGKIRLEYYDDSVVEAVTDFKNILETQGEVEIPKSNVKPKTLKMLTPLIVDKDTLSKDSKAETKKLFDKVKKERRSARRELKKDSQFLARIQLKETLKSDEERKRKVRIIMSGLATQESEHQKRKKMKH